MNKKITVSSFLLFFLTVFTLLFIFFGTKRDSYILKPDFYEAGHPEENTIWQELNKPSVCISISGHVGISLSEKENNVTIEQLELYLKSVPDRAQAIILLEKNYTGHNQLDVKVKDVLNKFHFKTIIVQSAHSSATVIEEVIRNN